MRAPRTSIISHSEGPRLSHPDVFHLVLSLAVGAFVGFGGGLFGIGGGLLAIPILGVFFHLNQQSAQGTSLVMVVPNVIVGVTTYVRRGSLDRRLALVLAASAVPFTFAGAHIATTLPSRPLRIAFIAFMLVLAAYFLLRALRSAPRVRTGRAVAWPWSIAVGAGGGVVSGIFSVGGAVFAVPLMAALYDLSQATAQGLGLSLVAPGTLVGLVAYAQAGDVNWVLGIPMGLGGVALVAPGVRLAHALPERALRMCFVVMLTASAAALWFTG